MSTGFWRRDSIPTTSKRATRAAFARLPRRITSSSIRKTRAVDIVHERQRQQRWKLVSHSASAENDFDAEQIARLTVLEVLYAKRRNEPRDPSITQPHLEELTGQPREHLEFTIWYLLQKKRIVRDDSMNISITADGVEHIEQNFQATLQTRRLPPAPRSTK